MKTLIIATLTLLTQIAAFADSTPEKQLSGRWDSLRFAFGMLHSDFYAERPIIVIYRTAKGGVLVSYDSSTITSRTLDEGQILLLVSRLSDFFAGAGGPPPANTQWEPPAFNMQLSIDNGLSRHSFFKNLDAQKELKLLNEYSHYIHEVSIAK